LSVYVALLRGINVGGAKTVKMEKLRDTFEKLGFGGVRTYVNSGNVVFESAPTDTGVLSKKIADKISVDFGFSVRVFVRSSDELQSVVEKNPFLKEKRIDESRLHVTFLTEQPSKATLARLDSLGADPDRYSSNGREIYLYCPNGYGRSKLSNNALEKALSLTATTRNWKTVNTVASLLRS